MPMATKEEQREYQRRWMAKRRADWFFDKECVWCRSIENLRLDHIDPKQKIDHKIWSWSRERRTQELLKCQVLCFPCHVIKTRDNKEYARGEDNGKSKLLESQIVEIRDLYNSGHFNQYEIAKLYNTGQKTISCVVRKESWSHV